MSKAKKIMVMGLMLLMVSGIGLGVMKTQPKQMCVIDPPGANPYVIDPPGANPY